MQTDFCPSLNTYVYWLKEPVGWFVVAFFSSVLIGSFFSPIGWPIAAGIAAVLLLGLGFPWIAMRVLRCELRCENAELREGDESHLVLRVRNPLPIPVLGVVVEDYFHSRNEQGEQGAELPTADCGLARIPALSSAEYRLPIRPLYRGRYPIGTPVIACGFPFGIYTARREIQSVKPVLVRPFVMNLVSEIEFSGAKLADAGEGQRSSEHGEFLGVREFRRGDSLRSIHWVQSARLDELVVCERGGPQKSPLKVQLLTGRDGETSTAARENLAWRVRIAATLVDLLSARHLPFELWIDQQRTDLPAGLAAANAAWDYLAEVPLDGNEQRHESNQDASLSAFKGPSDRSVGRDRIITIGPGQDGDHHSGRYVRLRVKMDDLASETHRTLVGRRVNNGVAQGVGSDEKSDKSGGVQLSTASSTSVSSATEKFQRGGEEHLVDLSSPIEVQLEHILSEVNREATAA